MRSGERRAEWSKKKISIGVLYNNYLCYFYIHNLLIFLSFSFSLFLAHFHSFIRFGSFHFYFILSRHSLFCFRAAACEFSMLLSSDSLRLQQNCAWDEHGRAILDEIPVATLPQVASPRPSLLLHPQPQEKEREEKEYHNDAIICTRDSEREIRRANNATIRYDDCLLLLHNN
jgi:hypothetical protein